MRENDTAKPDPLGAASSPAPGQIDLTETELAAMGARLRPGSWVEHVKASRAARQTPPAPTVEPPVAAIAPAPAAPETPAPEPANPPPSASEPPATAEPPRARDTPEAPSPTAAASAPEALPDSADPAARDQAAAPSVAAADDVEPTESARSTAPLFALDRSPERPAPATAEPPATVEAPPREPIHDLVTEAIPPSVIIAPVDAPPTVPDLTVVGEALRATLMSNVAAPEARDGPAPAVAEQTPPTEGASVESADAISWAQPSTNGGSSAPEPNIIIAAEPKGPTSQPMQSFFSGEVAAISDDESLLPFFVPSAGDAGHHGARPTEAPAPPPPWFERFFDADYLAYEPQPSDKLTRRESDFIVASLGLSDGARILDLACGTGRHAVELGARGFQVVGLDTSAVMLEHAAAASRSRKVAVDFVKGDMRGLAFRRFFDAVLCWGTSFGYFRDVENALVLRTIAHALRPGGRLLLQVVNRDFVLRDVPRTWWRREGDALILDEVDFDPRVARFRQRRSILRADGRERIDVVDLRGYALSELLSLLGAEGFVPLEISGRITTRGVFLGAESPHITILAELR